MKKLIIFFLIVFHFLHVEHATAQLYPVQVNTVIVPPYSPYLLDYVNGSPDKLFVNLLVRDINALNVQVKLKLKIEGASTGIKIETSPNANLGVIRLDGGVAKQLTTDALREYFNANNLVFTGITPQLYVAKNGELPEDFYRICFDVYEANTGARLSEAAGCVQTFVLLNDPPLLNFPEPDAQIAVLNHNNAAPQNIMFSWLPRHMGSPNSAFQTDYQLEIFELPPNWQGNINAFVQSQIPLVTKISPITSLVFGPGEVSLIAGRKYAYRVKAIAATGATSYDAFKNNGYSEVRSFSVQGDCLLPSNTDATLRGFDKATINWEPNANDNTQQYTVMYRQANGNDNWQLEKVVQATSLTIYDLKKNTTYEYKVSGAGGGCFSANNEFNTGDGTENRDITCNTAPVVTIDNTIPLAAMVVGDKVTVGDFTVVIDEVSGSNGNFTGKGHIPVPLFYNAGLAVSFGAIKVNTSKQLIEGKVITIEGEDFDASILDITQEGDNPIDIKLETGWEIKEVDNIKLDSANKTITITVTLPDGSTEEKVYSYVPGEKGVITDGKGNQYGIAKDGTVTKLPTKGAVNGDGSGMITDSTVSAKDLLRYIVPNVDLIPLLQQKSNHTCWATVATMMYCWNNKTSITEKEMVQKVGEKFVKRYDLNQPICANEKTVLLSKLGLKSEPLQSNGVAYYWNLLKNGTGSPIWVTTIDPKTAANKEEVHAWLLFGMSTTQKDLEPTGTGKNTKFIFFDPAKGIKDSTSFLNFIRKYEAVPVNNPYEGLITQIVRVQRNGESAERINEASCTPGQLEGGALASGWFVIKYGYETASDIGSTSDSEACNIATKAIRFSRLATVLDDSRVPQHMGTEVNAMRNAMWQALITAKYGEATAKEAGDAHESNPNAADNYDYKVNQLTVLYDLDHADEMCDLLNSIQARKIGSEKSQSWETDIAAAIFDLYYAHGLFVAEPVGNKYKVVRHKITKDQYDRYKEALKTTTVCGKLREAEMKQINDLLSNITIKTSRADAINALNIINNASGSTNGIAGIPFDKRIILLQIIASDCFLYENESEYALKLIAETKVSEQEKILHALLTIKDVNNKKTLLKALLGETFCGQTGESFTQTIKTISQYVNNVTNEKITGKDKTKLTISTILQKKILEFDPAFLSSNKVRVTMLDDGRVEFQRHPIGFTTINPIAMYEYATSSNDYEPFIVNPYDVVVLHSKDDRAISNTFRFEKDKKYITTGLQAYMLLYDLWGADVKKAAEVTLDIALLSTGVGELGIALKAGNYARVALSTADLVVGATDVIVKANYDTWVNQYPNIIHFWEGFQLAYGGARITGELVTLAKNVKIDINRARSALVTGDEDALRSLKNIEEAADDVIRKGAGVAGVLVDASVLNRLGSRQSLNFTGFVAKTDDAFIDVVIHFKDGKFVVHKEGALLSELSIDELANVIDNVQQGKSVRLLSCNDLEAAVELSKKTNKPFYASDGWVELYKNGEIRSQNPFFKFEKGNKGGALANVTDEIPDVTKVLLGVKETIDFARYANIRKYLGNANVKKYLNNNQLNKFENTLRNARHDVLKYIDELDESDFVELVRGYKDLLNSNKLTTFENAIKTADGFQGTHGWFSYWKLTPSIKSSLITIHDLKTANKLLPTGNATDIQLATLQAFTTNGDFINIPMRYNKSFLGAYAENGYKNILECLDELRKVDGRKVIGVKVLSGKAFSKADFESKFVGGSNKLINYTSFISTSKEQSVAEGFVELTKKWAGNGEKVAVIQRITSKDGVYINDLSDWGEHLGKVRHADAKLSIQIQEEVLLSPSNLKQIGEPIPILVNGVHKTIDGMKAYYIDFIQL